MKKLFVLFIIITATTLCNKSQGQDEKIVGPFKNKYLTIKYTPSYGTDNTIYRLVKYGEENLSTIIDERDNLRKQEKKMEKRIADLEKIIKTLLNI